jgi:hypothetical protein
MPLLKQWSGNDTSEMSLADDSLSALQEFYKRHRQNYVFGSGKIGTALKHYLEQSGTPASGFVTTETLAGFKKIYAVGEIGVILGVSDKYLPDVVSALTAVADERDIFSLPSAVRESMGERFSMASIRENFWLNIFTTNRCNLNCKSCSTFAPVCKPDYYTADAFRTDLEQFRELKLEKVNMLKFTGGEPTLHPQLFDMFEVGRGLFPDAVIECYTNGLLLNNLPEREIRRLSELRVHFVITEYPLSNLKLERFYAAAAQNALSWNVIYSEDQKFFSKRPLDFTKQTPKYMFVNCPRYRICDSVFLFKGKLYKCIYTFASKYFNDAFGTKLEVTKDDCLDVGNTDAGRVYEYMRTRLPFCGYCKPITELVPWGLSEKNIQEWT